MRTHRDGVVSVCLIYKVCNLELRLHYFKREKPQLKLLLQCNIPL